MRERRNEYFALKWIKTAKRAGQYIFTEVNYTRSGVGDFTYLGAKTMLYPLLLRNFPVTIITFFYPIIKFSQTH